MTQLEEIRAKLGPSIGLSFGNWMKLFLTKGISTFKYYYPRIFILNLINTFGIPFNIYEHLRYDKLIKKVNMKQSPIFILGHWRTGTTHLQNLLCEDPQFGYLTMLQAMFPKSFMSNRIYRKFLEKYLPETRPMDNMTMGVQAPTEEEMALENLFMYSFYNSLYLPKNLREDYDIFVRFKGLSPKTVEQWKKTYDYLLKKTTLYVKGKRLVLKSPANTSRIQILLELYPDAKFIHIYRNPYVVYPSTVNFYRKAFQPFMLQRLTKKELDNCIFTIYKKMMSDYFRYKNLIPKGNLIEVKFEDLEENPIAQLKNIYDGLKIPGFARVVPRFTRYLESVKEYKKNAYEFTQSTIDKVRKHWGFAIEWWNYEVPREAIILKKKKVPSIISQ